MFKMAMKENSASQKFSAKKPEKEILRILPCRGIYTLIIFLSKRKTLEIGRLGKATFPKGYYAYTGSALGPHDRSLQSRVYRHLRKEKPLRWHIDYLLKCAEAIVKAVLAAETSEKKECEINKLIAEKLEGKIIVKGFGASDCRENCGSHLIFLNERENADYEISMIYQKCFGDNFTFLALA